MSHSKEIEIYTAKNIKKESNDTFSLEITLDNQKFHLPIINVGTTEHPEYIAILDPRSPELGIAGANVLAEFLKKLKIDLIITAPSSKSEQMIQEANIKAELENQPIIILGGSTQENGQKHIYTKDEVVKLASPNGETYWIEECRPITLGPNDPSKFFAINEETLEKIINLIQQGKNIAFVDDVYSSGATINSLKKLISKALLDKQISVPTIPIIVVARESLASDEIFNDQETLIADNEALNLYASILIPVLAEIPETE
ncbi:MAG: hypothetical protein COU63_00205 [Candidatus Pacebacteria bacterium CG10_big_fil_rev_8_21_14_0_10_36_11]|nr:hypothetical protein [Candidatus Pacearchaeota archaeon]OIP74179.1 MAG: hypothetical protein AUK08_02955 [Candidatus Pacebacteria bacterium CG2_30_36_39]PIR65081.1 MAG: hypothetical protein COU63_00205 [Candidatus Pacebacteria bacterium CG10_big_fil_rev_8_21_14_0_10_36_11]PJC42419.1 MAG: hypothetical protein CO040_04625 [Candidatus Pacebacteria bacterium CG_4_9_14_0_2_um_filter_36_8]